MRKNYGTMRKLMCSNALVEGKLAEEKTEIRERENEGRRGKNEESGGKNYRNENWN